jgi:hypothetical protein
LRLPDLSGNEHDGTSKYALLHKKLGKIELYITQKQDAGYQYPEKIPLFSLRFHSSDFRGDYLKKIVINLSNNYENIRNLRIAYLDYQPIIGR